MYCILETGSVSVFLFYLCHYIQHSTLTFRKILFILLPWTDLCMEQLLLWPGVDFLWEPVFITFPTLWSMNMFCDYMLTSSCITPQPSSSAAALRPWQECLWLAVCNIDIFTAHCPPTHDLLLNFNHSPFNQRNELCNFHLYFISMSCYWYNTLLLLRR
jgi:hypothetical protein